MTLKELMTDVNYYTTGGKHIEGIQSPLAQFQKNITNLFFMTPRTPEEVERFGFNLVGNPEVVGLTEDRCPGIATVYQHFGDQAERYYQEQYSDSKGMTA